MGAGDHLHRLVSALVKDPLLRPEGTPVGHLAGFDVHAGVDRRFDEVSLTIPEAGVEIRFPTDEWRALDPSSLVQRLERRIQNLDSSLTEAQGDQSASNQEAERARARIGAPFVEPAIEAVLICGTTQVGVGSSVSYRSMAASSRALRTTTASRRRCGLEVHGARMPCWKRY